VGTMRIRTDEGERPSVRCHSIVKVREEVNRQWRRPLRRCRRRPLRRRWGRPLATRLAAVGLAISMLPFASFALASIVVAMLGFAVVLLTEFARVAVVARLSSTVYM
jgi:hypothetical protein